MANITRTYTHHTTATVRHIQQHYPRQPLREIAAELGLTYSSARALVRREGIKKNKPAY